jgi:coenzyme F420-reducing hydrogenase alpha subunit
VRWVAGFDFPDHAIDADLLALTRAGTYAIEEGMIATRSGLSFAPAGFDEHVIEDHVPHSTALHGYGATEAPRGTLWHRYDVDAGGLITAARIVPPTSQNQAAIEADLRAFMQAHLDLADAELTHRCEQAIRNYDPCVSCAAHFLDLTVERS